MVHDKDMVEIVRQRTTERKLDLANLNLDRFPTGIWALFGLKLGIARLGRFWLFKKNL